MLTKAQFNTPSDFCGFISSRQSECITDPHSHFELSTSTEDSKFVNSSVNISSKRHIYSTDDFFLNLCRNQANFKVNFKLFGFPTLSVPEEGYSRNASCAL